jgi:hypothetical protein
MNIKKVFNFFKKSKSRTASAGTLREFIYLDDVSVHSLLASKRGPVDIEYLDTLSNTRQSEVVGGIKINSGLAGAETKARRFDSQAHGTQVTRKSIIQALFKQLYDQEKESLALYPIGEAQIPVGQKVALNDMSRDLVRLKTEGLIIDPSNLTRGQLFEIEVQLEADMVFRISTVISVFREMIEENFPLLGNYDALDISTIKSVDKVLEKILVGLIPIKGLAIDYRVMFINGKEWIVHNKYIAQLNENIPTMPLYVVGVTEQRLYWKDIRRLLFAKSRYYALCRLSLDGTRNTWDPIKIVNLIDSVMPGLTQEMHLSQPSDLAKIINPNRPSTTVEIDDEYKIDQWQMKKALKIYADLIAKEFNISFSELDRDQIEALSEKNCTLFSTVDTRRIAFNAVLNNLSDRHKFEPDRDLTSDMRIDAIRRAKIDILAKDQHDQKDSLASSEQERFLDTEFIAIYW